MERSGLHAARMLTGNGGHPGAKASMDRSVRKRMGAEGSGKDTKGAYWSVLERNGSE